MISEQELYSQALAAFNADDLAKARDLFSQLLKIDRKNIDYWLWLSAAVETTKERTYCLREVLQLDPNNEEAALGLRMLGESAPPPPEIHTDPLFIPWKTQIELEDERPDHGKLGPRVVLFSILGIAVVGMIVFGLLRTFHPFQQQSTGAIIRYTLTPVPSSTLTLTPTITPTGPAALSINLDTTFTPTPLYVATPHNRLEAYSAGIRAYEKKDWASAASYFQQVLQVEPNDADVYFHLGNVYRYQGNYSQALSAYQSAMKIDANFAPAYLGEAQVYIYGPTVKYDAAITDLQKAIELDPNLNEASLELAELMIDQTSPDAALGMLEKLDAALPNNARVELIRAQAYLAKGDMDLALNAVNKAREYDRSILDIYLVWAKILQAQGKYQDSIVPILTYKANSPSSIGADVILAKAYYYTGKVEDAFTLLSDSLKKDNKITDAYLLRAEIYMQQKKYEEARADFNAVLRYDYSNFDANIGIGRVLLAKTLAGSAYNQFDYTEDMAKTDKQKAIFLYWRAASLQGLDMDSVAIRDYQAALAYPTGVLPSDLRQDAEKQIGVLATATPTTRSTATPQVTSTSMHTPTQATPSISPTLTKPSVTPTKKK
jgi:tetratricopeptide (TPR) repeat protein